MQTTVEISAQARHDLGEIFEYIAQDNPEAAIRFTNQLLETAFSLENAPLMGGRAKGRFKVRIIVHCPYLIFYRLETKENRIDVLRFWHGARDRKGLKLDL